MDTINVSLKNTPIIVTLSKTPGVHFYLCLTKCFIVPQQNSCLLQVILNFQRRSNTTKCAAHVLELLQILKWIN